MVNAWCDGKMSHGVIQHRQMAIFCRKILSVINFNCLHLLSSCCSLHRCQHIGHSLYERRPLIRFPEQTWLALSAQSLGVISCKRKQMGTQTNPIYPRLCRKLALSILIWPSRISFHANLFSAKLMKPWQASTRFCKGCMARDCKVYRGNCCGDCCGSSLCVCLRGACTGLCRRGWGAC